MESKRWYGVRRMKLHLKKWHGFESCVGLLIVTLHQNRCQLNWRLSHRWFQWLLLLANTWGSWKYVYILYTYGICFLLFFGYKNKNLGFLKKPGFFKSMVIHMYEEGNRYLSLNTLFYVNQTTSYTCAHPSTQNPSTWSHTHTEYCKPVVYLMLFVFSSAKSLIWQMPCSRQWDTGLMSFAWPI